MANIERADSELEDQKLATYKVRCKDKFIQIIFNYT